MDWTLILEIVCIVIWLALVVINIIRSIRDGKLTPIILEGIEAAEEQIGLNGEEKLVYAIDYIKNKAKENGIGVSIPKTTALINRLIELTKKVNVK